MSPLENVESVEQFGHHPTQDTFWWDRTRHIYPYMIDIRDELKIVEPTTLLLKLLTNLAEANVAETSSANSFFKLANFYFYFQKYEKAKKNYEFAADMGCHRSLFMLAYSYFEGRVFEKNYDTAINYFKQLLNENNYRNDSFLIGNAEFPDISLDEFLEGIDNKHIILLSYIADCYAHGYGVNSSTYAAGAYITCAKNQIEYKKTIGNYLVA